VVPVRDVGSLYRFAIMGNGAVGQPSGDEIAQMIAIVPSLDGVAATSSSHGTVLAGDRGANVDGSAVPPEYFKALGVRPRLGRLFTPEETEESGVAIVSDAVWKLLFLDRREIGKAILSYEGRDYAVVGVLPQGLEKVQGFGVWLPRPHHYPRFTSLLGRAKRGVSEGRIRADLQLVTARLTTVYGMGRPPFSVYLHSATPDPFQLKAYHGAMIGAALCILIIACGNVSALMLARGVVMRRDQAVRLSLGATRRNLLTTVAAEVFVIAMSGGIAGLFLATWLMHLVASFIPADPSALGIAFEAQWSGRVFAQSFAAMVAAISLAAVLPAWNAARIEPSEPLKESAGTTTGRAATRFRVLVIAELALSMTLLMGSTLIAKATRKVATFDFGYDARPLFIASANLTVRPDSARHAVDSLNAAGKRPQITATQLNAASERVRAIPGVISASPISGGLPERGTVISDDSRGRANALNLRIYLNVGPGFMKTLGVPIIAGRDFVEGDRAGRGGIILDAIAAKQLFPNGGAIGHLVKLGDEASKRPWIPVVGIARTAMLRFPTDADYDIEPQVYASVPLEPIGETDILVRPSDMRVGTILATQRVLNDQFPPNAFVHTARWLLDYEAALAARQFTASIFVGLAIASLALAAIGLFSVLSYSVGQRTREFAVRVALGANRNDVVRLVMRDGLIMALGGTAVGACLGVWGGSLLSRFLWDVSPWDAGALALAEVILLGVTMTSCLVPALRATRADPLAVLRAT
jgi:putative ABC transport system permease protein